MLSLCRPGYTQTPTTPTLQAIGVQFELFEVGRLEFSPSLVSDTDEKRRSISQFKLGFGGRIVRLSKSLKIFNKSFNDSLGYMRLTLND